jgi:diacylglycerol O-acyltransferase / wax synthase
MQRTTGVPGLKCESSAHLRARMRRFSAGHRRRCNSYTWIRQAAVVANVPCVDDIRRNRSFSCGFANTVEAPHRQGGTAMDAKRQSSRHLRLTGMDTMFLVTNLHTLKLSILESSNPERPLDADVVRDAIGQVLHAVPGFTQKLLPVPLGLHHPLLVGDGGFELAEHIHHRHLPPPGGGRQLDEVIGEVCASPLDLRRPLWEVHLFTGLEFGRVAVLFKLHHCLADGRVAANQLKALTAAAPAALAIDDTVPSRRTVVREAFRDRRKDLAQLPTLIRDTARRRRVVRSIRARTDVPAMLGGPCTRFSEKLSTQRTWGTVSIPLTDVKAVAKHYGVSINDVLMTMTGYAMRRFLDARGELPRESLTVGLPLDTSKPSDAAALQGNKVITAVATLGTDRADVVSQLHVIHRSMKVTKEIRDARGDLAERWLQYCHLPVLSRLARLVERYGLLTRAGLPPALVSNVRGPDEALQFQHLQVQNFFSVGPLIEGVGLNITAWSYAGQFNISLLSARNIVEAPQEFLSLMEAALEELAVRMNTPGKADSAPFAKDVLS